MKQEPDAMKQGQQVITNRRNFLISSAAAAGCRAHRDHADHPRSVRKGSRPEERVDGGPKSVFLRSAAHPHVSVVYHQVMVRPRHRPSLPS